MAYSLYLTFFLKTGTQPWLLELDIVSFNRWALKIWLLILFCGCYTFYYALVKIIWVTSYGSIWPINLPIVSSRSFLRNTCDCTLIALNCCWSIINIYFVIITQMWPNNELPNFRKTVISFYQTVSDLALRVLTVMAVGLELVG